MGAGELLANPATIANVSKINNSTINSTTFPVIEYPSNFNPLTDSVTIEGSSIVFIHYYSIQEILHLLTPLWFLLFVVCTYASYRYVAPKILTRFNNEN